MFELNKNRKPPVEYYATSWTNIEVKLFYYGNFNVVYPEAIRELAYGTFSPHSAPLRAAADADTDRVGPVRSPLVPPVAIRTPPIGGDNMHPMIGERWSESEAFRSGKSGDC